MVGDIAEEALAAGPVGDGGAAQVLAIHDDAAAHFDQLADDQEEEEGMQMRWQDEVRMFQEEHGDPDDTGAPLTLPSPETLSCFV